MAIRILYSTELIICFLNIALHGTGVKLLYDLQKNKRHPQQMLLILHLSLSELLMMSLEVIDVALNFYCRINTHDCLGHPNYVENNSTTPSIVFSEIQTNLNIIQLSGCYLVYHMSMIYITLDRFFHFYHHLRYNSIFTKKRVKRLCMWTWVSSGIFCAVMVVIHNTITFQLPGYNVPGYKSLAYLFIFPIFEVLFIICAVVSYTGIYYIVKAHHRSSSTLENNEYPVSTPSTPRVSTASTVTLTTGNHTEGRKVSTMSTATLDNTTVRMRLRIPTLLIATFMVFMVLPDLIYLGYLMAAQKPVPQWVENLTWMLYGISFTCDAVIYIFLQADVRKELHTRLNKFYKYLSDIRNRSDA